MRTPTRNPEDVLRCLSGWSGVIERHDQRLGQLLSNVAAYSGKDLFYMENADLLNAISKYLITLEDYK